MPPDVAAMLHDACQVLEAQLLALTVYVDVAAIVVVALVFLTPVQVPPATAATVVETLIFLYAEAVTDEAAVIATDCPPGVQTLAEAVCPAVAATVHVALINFLAVTLTVALAAAVVAPILLTATVDAGNDDVAAQVVA